LLLRSRDGPAPDSRAKGRPQSDSVPAACPLGQEKNDAMNRARGIAHDHTRMKA